MVESSGPVADREASVGGQHGDGLGVGGRSLLDALKGAPLARLPQGQAALVAGHEVSAAEGQARCTAVKPAASACPSMVSTALPAAAETGVTQERMG